jgi:hypothetical protein
MMKVKNHLINRAVAVIKPRHAYFCWTEEIPQHRDDTAKNGLHADCTAVLIPVFETRAESEAYIAGISVSLFEMELRAWNNDRMMWPVDLSYDVFRLWFDVQIHTIVVDTVGSKIVKEEAW